MRQKLIDAGWMKFGDIWVNPLTGECCSFEQAVDEHEQGLDRNEDDDE